MPSPGTGRKTRAARCLLTPQDAGGDAVAGYEPTRANRAGARRKATKSTAAPPCAGERSRPGSRGSALGRRRRLLAPRAVGEARRKLPKVRCRVADSYGSPTRRPMLRLTSLPRSSGASGAASAFDVRRGAACHRGTTWGKTAGSSVCGAAECRGWRSRSVRRAPAAGASGARECVLTSARCGVPSRKRAAEGEGIDLRAGGAVFVSRRVPAAGASRRRKPVGRRRGRGVPLRVGRRCRSGILWQQTRRRSPAGVARHCGSLSYGALARAAARGRPRHPSAFDVGEARRGGARDVGEACQRASTRLLRRARRSCSESKWPDVAPGSGV